MNRVYIIILAIVLTLIPISGAYAVPASPAIRSITMPDGSSIDVKLIGDERISWFETLDGYTIIKNPSGYFEYAMIDGNGGLAASGIKVGEAPPPEKEHLKPSRGVISSRISASSFKPAELVSLSQITGTEKVVVLLIEFTDVTHSSNHTTSYFSSLYFGSSFGEMNHYMEDISYGNLSIGGVASQWFSSIRQMSYYGYETGYYMMNINQLVVEAVSAADPYIDYSDYDQDADGYIDHLIIVHAGGDYAATSQPNEIWSHRGEISDYVTQDGTKAKGYVMVSEENLLGVHAHEFMHDLGAPDLYDYDYDGNPVSWWCIMDTGAYGGFPYGSVPTSLCGYLRYDVDADPTNGYKGWLSAEILSQSSSYGLTQLTDTTGSRLYRVDIPNDNEYFLLENRQFVGYDVSLPDSGIVVYHVDEDMPDGPYTWTINDGTPSNSFYRITVEDPGNTYMKGNAAYSQEDNQQTFDSYSSPNSTSNQNNASMIAVTNVSNSQQIMTFSLSVSGSSSNSPPDVSLSASPASGNIPLSVSFTGSATDSDGTIVSTLYNFGDGSTSTEQNPTHDYTVSGDYTAVLSATDDEGATSIAQVSISATHNNLPNVSVTASPSVGYAPLTVNFTGSASDSNGFITAYNYDFGDGSTSTEQNPSHVFPADGEYTVIFSATDNENGTSSAELTITVLENAPPSVSVTATPTSGSAPISVSFTGSASDSDGYISAYNYDFGDGDTASEQDSAHVFTDEGEYIVTFSATDNRGATAIAQVIITVTPGSGSGSSGGGCGTISGGAMRPPPASLNQIMFDLMLFMLPGIFVIRKRAYLVFV